METHEFNSSNIDSATYDGDTAELTVTFVNGATYRYDNVGWDDWNGLCNAPSAGSFFARSIKNVYPTTRIS